jgi:hypothetical protein
MDEVALGGFADATRPDAVRADFDPLGRAIHDSPYNLKIGFEQTGSDGGDMLSNAALFLGLSAPVDGAAARIAFTANFTTSSHD